MSTVLCVMQLQMRRHRIYCIELARRPTWSLKACTRTHVAPSGRGSFRCDYDHERDLSSFYSAAMNATRTWLISPYHKHEAEGLNGAQCLSPPLALVRGHRRHPAHLAKCHLLPATSMNLSTESYHRSSQVIGVSHVRNASNTSMAVSKEGLLLVPDFASTAHMLQRLSIHTSCLLAFGALADTLSTSCY